MFSEQDVAALAAALYRVQSTGSRSEESFVQAVVQAYLDERSSWPDKPETARA